MITLLMVTVLTYLAAAIYCGHSLVSLVGLNPLCLLP
jgi:hypothetical protein